MKAISILSLILLSLTGGVHGQTKPPHLEWRQLKDASQDTVEITGYVFDVYICPPCPQGAQCKPCMPNHITLVEEWVDDPQRVPLEGRLRVYTEQPEVFKLGDHYRFTISRKGKTLEYEARLVSYEP